VKITSVYPNAPGLPGGVHVGEMGYTEVQLNDKFGAGSGWLIVDDYPPSPGATGMLVVEKQS
jgi:hypothetical protein